MKGPVLIAGSSRTICPRLVPLLRERGLEVRVATRRIERAPLPEPGLRYVSCNFDDARSVRKALAGCEAAYWLVHSVGASENLGHEAELARKFARCADRAGVERVITLAVPLHERIGAAFQGLSFRAFALEASLIVGHGSAAWRIVRDLAERSPAMILPRWTDSRIQPVALDDVVDALFGALFVRANGPQDLPGPETLSVRQVLERVARLRGRRPYAVRVPIATPWLSRLWLRFVSRADAKAAEEMVAAFGRDMLLHDGGFWSAIGKEELVSFDEAVLRAFEDEALAEEPPLVEQAMERLTGFFSRRVA